MASCPDSTRRWREAEIFRRTFLNSLNEPEQIKAFEAVGRWLYLWSLEYSGTPASPEASPVHETLRAAYDDLRFTEGYLVHVVASLDETAYLDPVSAGLARQSLDWSREIDGIAEAMQKGLAK